MDAINSAEPDRANATRWFFSFCELEVKLGIPQVRSVSFEAFLETITPGKENYLRFPVDELMQFTPEKLKVFRWAVPTYALSEKEPALVLAVLMNNLHLPSKGYHRDDELKAAWRSLFENIDLQLVLSYLALRRGELDEENVLLCLRVFFYELKFMAREKIDKMFPRQTLLDMWRKKPLLQKLFQGFDMGPHLRNVLQSSFGAKVGSSGHTFFRTHSCSVRDIKLQISREEVLRLEDLVPSNIRKYFTDLVGVLFEYIGKIESAPYSERKDWHVEKAGYVRFLLWNVVALVATGRRLSVDITRKITYDLDLVFRGTLDRASALDTSCSGFF